MHCWPGEGDRINLFAVVSYIPGPLGDFLDDLRRALVQGCNAQSHVTVLPPRELPSPEAAAEQLTVELKSILPFQISLGEVEVFDNTSVVYLSVKDGKTILERLHEHLSDVAPLWFEERFYYHPHVTLAQEFPREHIEEVAKFAQECWEEYDGPREFTVTALTFVKNTDGNHWIDLRTYDLDDADSAGASG